MDKVFLGAILGLPVNHLVIPEVKDFSVLQLAPAKNDDKNTDRLSRGLWEPWTKSTVFNSILWDTAPL